MLQLWVGGFFLIILKNSKNENEEGCLEMSANSSEFLWKLSCSELTSLSRLETFFVPTKKCSQ